MSTVCERLMFLHTSGYESDSAAGQGNQTHRDEEANADLHRTSKSAGAGGVCVL